MTPRNGSVAPGAVYGTLRTVIRPGQSHCPNMPTGVDTATVGGLVGLPYTSTIELPPGP